MVWVHRAAQVVIGSDQIYSLRPCSALWYDFLSDLPNQPNSIDLKKNGPGLTLFTKQILIPTQEKGGVHSDPFNYSKTRVFIYLFNISTITSGEGSLNFKFYRKKIEQYHQISKPFGVNQVLLVCFLYYY